MSLRRPALQAMLVVVILCACHSEPPVALGTLERDRLSLPAPTFERIASIAVREGQPVRAGDVLLELESARSAARLEGARAEQERALALLAELEAGPRPEAIAEARARLAGAQAIAHHAGQEFDRVQRIVARRLQPPAALDGARAARDAANAEVRIAREALSLLEHGNRPEQIAQAQAGASAARAQVDALAVDRERTRITAPVDGWVERLPFEVGEQQPVGTPLAILLVGDRPYARVYVPQPLRLRIQIGSPAQITLQGDRRVFPGRVRAIRHAPVFTPYYALSGKDASRLSWLAEIELEASAAALPSGMPLAARFDQDKAPLPP